MRKNVLAALTLALIGIIFLASGAGVSLKAVTSTAVCEACGMLVEKDDISTFKIVAADGSEHWACCPICAEVEAIYYVNSEIIARCFVTGDEIKIGVANGNFTSATVTPATHGNDVTIVLGGSCATNKIVSTKADGEKVIQTYDWASNASLKTVPQSFVAAKTKLTQMTVGYRPVEIPSINYILIGVGAALTAAAPVSWKLGQKKTKVTAE